MAAFRHEQQGLCPSASVVSFSDDLVVLDNDRGNWNFTQCCSFLGEFNACRINILVDL